MNEIGICENGGQFGTEIRAKGEMNEGVLFYMERHLVYMERHLAEFALCGEESVRGGIR